MGSLERVAEKIGMEWITDEIGPRWYDSHERCCDEVDDVDPSGLRTYLLTGDRPLRIFDAVRAAGWRIVIRSLTDKVVILWVRTPATAKGGDLVAIHDSQSATCDSLAEAIRACAEAVA